MKQNDQRKRKRDYIIKMYDTKSYAERYSRSKPAQNIHQRKLDMEFATVFSNLDLNDFSNRKANALDIGCASGRYVSTLANKDINAIGIDTAITSLKYAYKSVESPYASFIMCDALNLPFKRETFDIIISMELFYHFSDEVFEEVLAQVRDIIKPGGLFVFDIKNKLNPIVHIIKKRCEKNKLYPYEIRTVSQIKKLLNKYNFKIIKKKGIFLPTPFAPFEIIFAKKR